MSIVIARNSLMSQMQFAIKIAHDEFLLKRFKIVISNFKVSKRA